jgi:hypothetical protein
MSGPERKQIPVKSFEEVEVGDTLYDPFTLGWQLVCPIPRDVAETWVLSCFVNATIAPGWTASTAPIQKWEVGYGVVVGSVVAFPGEERLNLLHKMGTEDFRLYLSEQSRERKKA